MAKYALWGGLVAIVVVFVLTFLWTRRRGDLEGFVVLLLGGAASLIALAINKGVSDAVNRVRPCHALHHVVVILGCANDASLPSDHSVIAGALAVTLLLIGWRIGLVGVVLALSVAFARVYAGVHYPGDVVAGLLLGGLVALAMVLALRRPVLDAVIKLVRTRLRPLISARASAASEPADGPGSVGEPAGAAGTLDPAGAAPVRPRT